MNPPVPILAQMQRAQQPADQARRHEAPRRASDAFSKSLPVSIPLPGLMDIGPRRPQVGPDAYSFESQAPRHRHGHGHGHGQMMSHAPFRSADYGCSCCYNPGGYLAADPRQSPSPPLDGSPCACCPQPYAYPQQVPYFELTEPALGRAAPMSMPVPMPSPMNYMSMSMPPYALPMTQKPRKRVTFADPIAEYKIVPCESSSAPEHARMPLVEAPIPGRCRRRNSISVHRDRNQASASDYGSHSRSSTGNYGHHAGAAAGDASGNSMLLSSYTICPATTSGYGDSSHKRRTRSDHALRTDSITPPSVLHRSQERPRQVPTATSRDRTSLFQEASYNGAFSLSSEHLPLPA
ncbi:hypothetical protein LPJ61_001908 [Coemansia biformis]|uniref:Uncharacterized protein n=1 Tax=Coemansia biformis TaxID=1286918 RepID=A0A9W7YFI6_9FUNG|nr:hypothetical protein LPJ61_001908 [Coemansia biformis]